MNSNQDRQKKIMMISRSYKNGEIASHLQQIIRIADQNEVDTIMFAGWAYDRKHPRPTYEMMFGNSGTVNHVLMEIADTATDSNMETLFFSRNEVGPRVIHQRFGHSSDRREKKAEFIGELDSRVSGETASIVCGEIGTLIYSRNQESIVDEYELNNKLEEANIKVILNYWHTYGRRYEINKKRQHLSLNGRIVASVWNHGCVEREIKTPWAVFADGRDMTAEIQELPTPFRDRSDIKIGIYQF